MFVLYDGIQKQAILIIHMYVIDFEYCPRGYIEGGYYSFTRPSTAGIIRVRVLFKGGSYLRKYGRTQKKSEIHFGRTRKIKTLSVYLTQKRSNTTGLTSNN